jgi:hypothetical protein
VDIDSLNDAERQLLRAIESRTLADFSSQPARRIRATLLQSIMSASPGPLPALCCPLRIRGAEIVGPLLAPSAALGSGGHIALMFVACSFDAPVDFSGADFISLRFVDCTLPAFIGSSISTKADLDLSGCRLHGVSGYESELADVGSCAVYLNNARIGGHLLFRSTAASRFSASGTLRLDGARIDGDVSLEGALLDGRGDAALHAHSMHVGGNVVLNPVFGYRCEANGEVALVASQIRGDLSCDAARLSNPSGRALHCEDLKVESVWLTAQSSIDVPFEASGRLNFLSATVGGSFFLMGARLSPGPDYRGMLGIGGPVAANLQQTRISNALVLSNNGALEPGTPAVPPSQKAAPVAGWFLLSGAEVRTIIDNTETGWPGTGYLDLEGTSYERIRNVDDGDLVRKRIAWLHRQYPGGKSDASNFRPQPYEALSRALRASGLTQEADAIAVDKIRMRLAARVDGPLARVFPSLLMLVSHHGYSSRRALIAFTVFVLLGAAMYTAALWGFQQPFLPVEAAAEATRYVLPFGLGHVDAARGCPGLDVLQYALDLALPVIELGQDTVCRFVPEGRARQLWLLLHAVYAIGGAALSAILVLTLTGILRRD